MNYVKSIGIVLVALIALSLPGIAQVVDHGAALVGDINHPLPLHSTDRTAIEGYTGTPFHEVTVTQRCGQASFDKGICKHVGDVIKSEVTHNLRTSAGTTWQYTQMFGSPGVAVTYFGVSPTAVTPAEADTTLSGETTSNGFACAGVRCVATPSNASGTLAVPAAPTLVATGGGGGTAQYYFVFACNQLSGTTPICTTPGTVSASVTPGATMSATVYVTGTFTGIPGAQSYIVVRSNSSSAPSGSLAGGATQSSTGQISNPVVSCGTGAAPTCTFVDQSNTLTAFTVPASNLTNFGKATLVYTYTATATQTINSFGVFTASSAGTMAFEGVLASSYTMNSGDTFQLTETPYF